MLSFSKPSFLVTGLNLGLSTEFVYKQHVKIYDEDVYGVPQGSVFGPLIIG